MRVFIASILCAGFLMTEVGWGDNGPNHQTSSNSYGVSGGNVNDRSSAFCCGGTLGSLITDGTTTYILSNNHVLARSGAASPGEAITQPGLIDNACQQARLVADLAPSPALGTNVDAAVAALRPGTMSLGGEILDIGQISTTVRPPAIGLSVAKSGRTTGLTYGSIQSVNATVTVQYRLGCGSGKKFSVTYKNQIVITPGSFSAGGDSGSLVVTSDANCPQPVGLLFAGSSTSTIANPIGEVLNKVGTALGRNVSFVGKTCTPSTTTTALSSGPSPAVVGNAASVLQEHLPELMRGPVIGIGVGAAENNPLEAVLVVYIDRTQGVTPNLPDHVRGVRVRRMFTDPFVALPACGSCNGGAAACK